MGAHPSIGPLAGWSEDHKKVRFPPMNWDILASKGYPNSYETGPKEETGAMGQTVGRPPFTACCRAAALPPPPTQYGSREKEREELAQIAKAMLVARSQ